MTTKHTPATPLPYAAQDVSGQYFLTGLDHDGLTQLRVAEFILRADRAYIAHAANAYPKLVEDARDTFKLLDRLASKFSEDDEIAAQFHRTSALLRKLGEE